MRLLQKHYSKGKFMDQGYSIAFFLIVFVALFIDSLNVSKARNKIRDRANDEFESGKELTKQEIEERLSESELMYEDLEQKYWLHVGFLVGVCSYFIWHVWYISLALGTVICVIGIKYITLRPFANGTPTTRSKN